MEILALTAVKGDAVALTQPPGTPTGTTYGVPSGAFSTVVPVPPSSNPERKALLTNW